MEASFSQARNKLWRLAQSYINEAHIKCVILIELPYRKRDKSIGSTATISIWRAQTVESHSMDIRNNAKALRSGSVNLYPEDFRPTNALPEASSSAVIEIPIAPLASLLSIAKNRMTTPKLLRNCPVKAPIDVSQLDDVTAREGGGEALTSTDW